MYEPKELYEKIVAVRRRDAVGADVACETVFRELKFRDHPVLRESGDFLLRAVERNYFRIYGYSAGHTTPDAQAPHARAPLNGGHGCRDAHSRHASESSSDGHYGTDTQRTPAVVPTITKEQAGGHRFPDAHAEPTPSPLDAQRFPPVAPFDGGERGHSERDAHFASAPNSAVAQPLSENTGGHSCRDAQLSTAPGVPWMDRVPWLDWSSECSMPGVQRKPQGDVTHEDCAVALGILTKSHETMLDTIRMYQTLYDSTEPGETIRHAFERTNGAITIRRALRRLAGDKKAA